MKLLQQSRVEAEEEEDAKSGGIRRTRSVDEGRRACSRRRLFAGTCGCAWRGRGSWRGRGLGGI